ncbi:MAG: hypothetical protein ABJE95_25280 [Byssovorax sp.]
MPEPEFAILDQPHHALHADQWEEGGYVLWAGRVYAYSIDRKNQIDEISRDWSPEGFLADPAVEERARRWLLAAR